MRTGRTQTIGLVIADIRVPFFPELAYCVQRAALKRGYSVVIVDTDGTPEQTAERILTLKAMAVDGVITTETLPAVFDLGLPTVMIGAPVRGLDSVTSERRRRWRHDRRPSAVAWSSSHRAGVEPARLVHPRSPRGPARRPERTGEGRLGGVTPPSEIITNDIRRMFNSIDVTAVVCSHDLIAIGVLRALWEMGVSVPADVSVIGFDDVQWSAVVSPGLTTIRQPFAELAQQAVEVLLDRMERPERRARRVVVWTSPWSSARPSPTCGKRRQIAAGSPSSGRTASCKRRERERSAVRAPAGCHRSAERCVASRSAG